MTQRTKLLKFDKDIEFQPEKLFIDFEKPWIDKEKRQHYKFTYDDSRLLIRFPKTFSNGVVKYNYEHNVNLRYDPTNTDPTVKNCLAFLEALYKEISKRVKAHLDYNSMPDATLNTFDDKISFFIACKSNKENKFIHNMYEINNKLPKKIIAEKSLEKPGNYIVLAKLFNFYVQPSNMKITYYAETLYYEPVLHEADHQTLIGDLL